MSTASADALWREVRAAAIDAGLDDVGVTDVAPFPDVRRSIESRLRNGQHAGMSFTFSNPRRSTEPQRLLRDARSLVVGTRHYLEPRPARPAGAVAAVARYAWRDHYAELRRGLDAAAGVLRDHGHRAAVFADTNHLVDRAAAHRAGLGWWGRNANLLVPGAGSWFVLGSVVTDVDLPSAAAPVADGCRTCTRCVSACPTGAIVDDGVIDARRCLAWLVQAAGVFPRAYRVALGDRLYGCDDCQDVCPPGRRDVLASDEGRSGPGSEPVWSDGSRGGGVDAAWVPILELLDASDEVLLERHGRWYIPRRQPRYLRRNALVVLGNVGDGGDGAHGAALARWSTSDDPLLRAHAVWAAARLGRHDLVGARLADTDPRVRAEVVLAPSVPPAPGAVSTTSVGVR